MRGAQPFPSWSYECAPGGDVGSELGGSTMTRSEHEDSAPAVGAEDATGPDRLPAPVSSTTTHRSEGVSDMNDKLGAQGTTGVQESEPKLLLPADPGFAEIEAQAEERSGLSRRSVLRLGALGVAGVTLAGGRALAEPYLGPRGLMTPEGVFAAAATAITDAVYVEAFPTSPLILKPVHRRAAGAEGRAARQLLRLDVQAGTWSGRAELAPERAPPDVEGLLRRPGPDRLQAGRLGGVPHVHRLARAADRQERPTRRVLRRRRQDLRGRDAAEAADRAPGTTTRATATPGSFP